MRYSLLVPLALSQVVFSAPSGNSLKPRDGVITLQAYKLSNSTQQRPISRRANGNAPLADTYWRVDLLVGTPGQSQSTMLDSGANNFYVSSTLLQPGSIYSGQDLFNANKSSTAKLVPNYTSYDCYGNGWCYWGLQYTDTVTIGDVSYAAVPLGVEYNMTSLGFQSWDATIGINLAAWQTTIPSSNAIPSFMQFIQSQLSQGVITIDFDSTSETGTIEFGTIDTTKYSGNIGWVPTAASGGEYVLNVQGLYVNDTWWTVEVDAIVDTGSQGTWFPEAFVSTYFSQVEGAQTTGYVTEGGQWVYQCGAQLPDLVMAAGDAIIVIPGANIASTEQYTDTLCYSILNIESGSLVGENWIEGIFAIFDFENGRFGAAAKASTPTTTSYPAYTPGHTPPPAALPPPPAEPSSIDSVVTACTGVNKSGQCQTLGFQSFSCYDFKIYQPGFINDVGTLAPVKGDGCTIYANTGCTSPYTDSDGNNIQYPNGYVLSSQTIGSFMCTRPVYTVQGSSSSRFCQDEGFAGTCAEVGWQSWNCNALPGFAQGSLGSFDPRNGTCTFYNDPQCTNKVSGASPITSGFQLSSWGAEAYYFVCI